MTLLQTSTARFGETREGKIIELRELLAQRFPRPPSTPTLAKLTTGVAVLDRCLDGGLPKGAITEIVCPGASMGSGSMVQALVESTSAAGRQLALVDAGDSFDPDGLSNADLAALLWVQCADVEQALKATDILLRDGNLPLVMLDLMMYSEREVRAIPSTYWYRLQRIAEDNGSTALTFTPVSVVGSAACALRLTRRFGLSALDLLRGQFTAGLQVETLRARAASRLGHHDRPLELAVG